MAMDPFAAAHKEATPVWESRAHGRPARSGAAARRAEADKSCSHAGRRTSPVNERLCKWQYVDCSVKP